MNLTQRHSDMLDQLWYKVIGINIGTGYTKARCGDRLLDEMPSVVSLVNASIDYEEMYKADDVVLEYEGQRYAVGFSATRFGSTAQPDRSDDRLRSKDYLLLFLATLMQIAPEDRRTTEFEPESIVLVAPLTSYNNDRNSIKKALAGTHEVGVVKKGRLVRRVSFIIHEEAIRVIPEGRGTLALLTITEDGLPYDPNGYAESQVGIVNIGTGTTELLYYENMYPVPAKTRGKHIGLSNVWRSISNWANSVHNFQMSDYEANKAMRQGYFNVGSRRIYISQGDFNYRDGDNPDLLSAAIAEQAKQVANFISTEWQSGKDVYYMPFAGGGAVDFYPFIKSRFEHAEVVHNPIHAEASGAYLYGMFKALSEAGILKDYTK